MAQRRGAGDFPLRKDVSGFGVADCAPDAAHLRALRPRPARLTVHAGRPRRRMAWGESAMWNQIYNPLGSTVLSTIAAAIPVITLLVLIASGKVKAHIAAIIAVILTNLIAIFIFTMPASLSIRASVLGIVAGFFPIGWIVLNVIFLYQLTVATGQFELLKRAVGGVTEDRRLQLLLIAFSFGASVEC